MSVLNQEVLVLNKVWTAINVVTVRRAIKMIYKGEATIINPSNYQTMTWADWSALRPKEDEKYITTSGSRICVPEVILLLDYSKFPKQRSNFSRRSLHRRDNNTCMYCGSQPGTEELTIDHVLPKSMGGTTNWLNCVCACVSCNSRKANRTPEQAGMKLIRQPFRPKFSLFKRSVRIKSWENFVSELYWECEIKN